MGPLDALCVAAVEVEELVRAGVRFCKRKKTVGGKKKRCALRRRARWRPQEDSNLCFRPEKPASLATRRWGQGENGRCAGRVDPSRRPWARPGCSGNAERGQDLSPVARVDLRRLGRTTQNAGDLDEISRVNRSCPRSTQASGGSTMRLAADSWKVGSSTGNSAGRVSNMVTSVLS